MSILHKFHVNRNIQIIDNHAINRTSFTAAECGFSDIRVRLEKTIHEQNY